MTALRLAGACALLGVSLACASEVETMPIERVALDLLAGEPFWETLRSPATSEVRVGTITPSVDPRMNGADRLALLLEPNAEASFRVPDLGRTVELKTAVGVDVSVERALAKLENEALTVRFELAIDERTVFTEDVRVEPKLASEFATRADVINDWHAVGEDGRLAVPAGSRIRLRTTLVGERPDGLEELRAGFADLQLVEHSERPREPATPERPNVVLIVMDTLRNDRTSPAGYERKTTPHLARLASEGLEYTTAYATSSWTWPSTTSLLTGLEPGAHGVISYTSCLLAHEIRTLAEALQDVGYTTATFSGNPLISPWRNFDQGVEHFDSSADLRQSRDVVPSALEWISAHAEWRFFVHFQLMDPHSPHVPRKTDMERFCGTTDAPVPSTFLNAVSTTLRVRKEHDENGRPRPELVVSRDQMRWLSDVYDASVATGDYWLGTILEHIDSLGLSDRTLFVFTSDHGEELFDHGLLEHSHALYEELVRVPLVFHGPRVPNARIESPVSNLAIAATVAQLVGADLPGPALDFRELERLEPIFFDTHKGWWNGREFQPVYGVRVDHWVLHYAPEATPWGAPRAEPNGGEARLYDLSSDPTQQVDRAADEPRRVESMKRLLLDHLASVAADAPARAVEAGAATEAILEAMGYGGGDDR